MKMWTKTNEENRIVMVTKEKQDEEQFLFDFPSDFAFSEIINYKIVDGELVYDEFIYTEPETEEVFEVEQAYAELIYNQMLIIDSMDNQEQTLADILFEKINEEESEE